MPTKLAIHRKKAVVVCCISLGVAAVVIKSADALVELLYLTGLFMVREKLTAASIMENSASRRVRSLYFMLVKILSTTD